VNEIRSLGLGRTSTGNDGGPLICPHVWMQLLRTTLPDDQPSATLESPCRRRRWPRAPVEALPSIPGLNRRFFAAQDTLVLSRRVNDLRGILTILGRPRKIPRRTIFPRHEPPKGRDDGVRSLTQNTTATTK
jgi:hypothetical protein